MDLLEAIMEELQLVQFVIKEAFGFTVAGLTFGILQICPQVFQGLVR